MASDTARIGHLDALEFVPQVQLHFLHQEDAAKEFHGPKDDKGGLREKGTPRHARQLLQGQAGDGNQPEQEPRFGGLVPEASVV